MICSTCGKAIQAGGVFCSSCGSAIDGTRYALEQRRLTRPIGSRAIAGVCSGIAQYFGWDVSTVRLVTAVAAFFGAGTPVLLYLIAWIVMPNSPQVVPMQTTSGTDVAAQ